MGHTRTGYEPAIYVGDYASYNNGSLAGTWMTLDGKTVEEIKAEIASIMKDNEKANGGRWECEEPMIQDYENFPREFYDECMSYDLLVQYLELEDYQKECFEVCLDASYSLEECFENYEEVRLYESKDEIVDEWIQIWEIPEKLEYYIDHEKVIRDLEVDGLLAETTAGWAYLPY